jgi:hypothetical protein
MSSLALHQIIRSHQQYNSRINGVSELQREMQLIHTNYPYSYMLLLAFSLHWRRLSCVNVARLPPDQIDNVINAIAQRCDYGIDINRIPLSLFNFHYCPLCFKEITMTDTLHLLPAHSAVLREYLSQSVHNRTAFKHDVKWAPDDVADHQHLGDSDEEEKTTAHCHLDDTMPFTRSKKPKRIRVIFVNDHPCIEKDQYVIEVRKQIGFRKPACDYISGEMYCSHTNVTAHRQCKKVPLARVLLLGKMLQLHRQLFFLCPQPGCGLVARWWPQFAECTEYGIACVLCSSAIKKFRQRHQLAHYTNVTDPPGDNVPFIPPSSTPASKWWTEVWNVRRQLYHDINGQLPE